jgi:hypothetical protein
MSLDYDSKSCRSHQASSLLHHRERIGCSEHRLFRTLGLRFLFVVNHNNQVVGIVDARIIREIQTGLNAIQAGDAFDIIYANAVGPYGSEVLPGVQEASDKVWNEVVLRNKVGQDWYKATTIQVNAYPDKAWTAQAIRPDGTLGTLFEFKKL